MRTLVKTALAVVVVSVILGASQPALASCGSFGLIGTQSSPDDRSFIWTADLFEPHYSGSYVYDTEPPVTADFRASFWALGSGDPALGAGNDNGSWDVVANGFYYYTNDSMGTMYFYGGEIFTGWGTSSAIDGCAFNSGSTSGDECTVVLLTDQYQDQGYVAVASAQVTATGSFYFDQPGNAPIVLSPLPEPTLIETPGPNPNLITLEITVPRPVDGLYLQESCDSEVGFKVYGQLVDPGMDPPVGRDLSLWTPLTAVVTPVDATLNLEVSCHSGQDFFLSTSLVFDSGFETAYTSASSQRFVCGCPVASGGDGFADSCFTCIDNDGDGYGLVGDPSCAAGAEEDCDDHDPFSFPGGREVYDAVDNNCDGTIDEELDLDGDGVPDFYDLCDATPTGSGVAPDGCSICGIDADGDGFSADSDCDDADPAINPAAAELPGNTVDEDCDGTLSCDPTLPWENHGQYVSCLADACRLLTASGVMTAQECAEIISSAHERGGLRKKPRPPTDRKRGSRDSAAGKE